MKTNSTREQVEVPMQAIPRYPKHLTSERIEWQIQELAMTNLPKRSKIAVWG